jgi:surface antigen
MKRITLVLTVLLWAVLGYSATVAQNYGGSTDTFQSALENNRTNQASTWVNPDTGVSGTVVPVRTFQNNQGQPCREFQRTILIGGREERGYGTACRQPDGSWRIVSGPPAVQTAAPPVERRTTVYVREVPRPYPYYYPYYPYYPYNPYGYYAPWGYGYPYWYPFSFSFNLGYLYYGGHRHGGHHHGGHRR